MSRKDHRVLTVREPWASLLAYGVKEYETRTKPTAFRGLVLIHAGLYSDDSCRAVADANRGHLIASGLLPACQPDWFDGLKRGAIIGAARITDSIPSEVLSEQGKLSTLERSLGDHGPERHAWRFESPVVFSTPVEGWAGVLGLRVLPDEILARCLDEIHRSTNPLQSAKLFGPACAAEAA